MPAKVDNKDRHRNFMWTLNNYTDEEVTQIKSLSPSVTYNVFGYEVGKENNTPHLQGATIFKTVKTWKQAKDMLPVRCAELQQIIYLQEALDYCVKDGNIYETGVKPITQEAKGKKEIDRHRHINKLAKENSLEELEKLYPDVWRRDYTKLKTIAKDHMVTPASIPVLNNEWIYGPTGTGKSRSVLDRYPNAYLKAADTKWWDGYQGQDVVFIDDFDKYHVAQGYHIKIWADHKPFLAETKGGAMVIRPKQIIITSNYSISEIWEDLTTSEPLHRRFTVTHLVTPLYNVPHCTVDAMEDEEMLAPLFRQSCRPSVVAANMFSPAQEYISSKEKTKRKTDSLFKLYKEKHSPKMFDMTL
uniref:ATP-dependent helicase Rep n=1 Tax=Antarctic circular DNA molecule TaxID=2664238 RepID=A0A5Q2F2H2_9ZZZZ|nr:replication associated protein [Antarctic circular DNA molecule]